MRGVTLDAGALIAVEKGDRRVLTALRRAALEGMAVRIPAGVVGQVWRDGERQARLARLLGSAGVTIVPLVDATARAAGQLCGATGTRDVIDASVVIVARKHADLIFTSDVDELRALAPKAELERV